MQNAQFAMLTKTSVGTSKRSNPVVGYAFGLCLSLLPVAGILLSKTAPEKIAWLNLTLIGMIYVLSIRSAGKFDKTHPLVWLATALAVMYVIHPLAYIADGGFNKYYHSRLLTEPGYSEAMVLALLASSAVIAGWLFAQLTSRRAKITVKKLVAIEKSNDERKARTAIQLSWTLIVFALFAFSLFAISTGQNPIDAIIGGAQRGSNTSSSAYLYLAPQAIGPATLLRAYANNVLQRSQRSVLVLALLQAVLYIPTGQRLVLVLTLVPTLLFLAYLRNFQLRTLGTILVIGGVLTAIVVLRDAGSAAGTTLVESAQASLSNPGRALTDFATGPDTEMIDGLAVEVQRVPDVIGHRPGLTLLSSLAAPIPSVLWPGKPVSADSILNSEILGTKKNFASVAYGFIGELFFDSGYLGVATGFFLFSIACFALWSYRNRFLNSPLHMMLYFTLLPVIVIHLRGSLALTLGRMLFIVGPILLMLYLVKDSRGRALARGRRSRVT